MARHRFGEGEYRYLREPYPEPVQALRRALYPRLLPIARDWWARLGRPALWPDQFDDWLDMCHAAGQTKSTALMLKYGPGYWNALHRDLYGDLVFPLQVVINLSEPGVDHTGAATSSPPGSGPVRSARGWSAAPVRHGVSVVRSGERYTLVLIFHDAA